MAATAAATLTGAEAVQIMAETFGADGLGWHVVVHDEKGDPYVSTMDPRIMQSTVYSVFKVQTAAELRESIVADFTHEVSLSSVHLAHITDAELDDDAAAEIRITYAPEGLAGAKVLRATAKALTEALPARKVVIYDESDGVPFNTDAVKQSFEMFACTFQTEYNFGRMIKEDLAHDCPECTIYLTSREPDDDDPAIAAYFRVTYA